MKYQVKNIGKAIALRLMLGLFFVSAIMVLIISVAVNIQMKRYEKMINESAQNHLTAAAQALSQYISAEELDRYHTKEDTNNQEYQDIKNRLIEFAEKCNVLYAYYWREYEKDTLQYIVDNDTDPESEVGPWIIQDIVEDIAFQALAGNNSVTDMRSVTPTWDGFVTAYAPVYDREGNIYCVAGVDLSHEIFFIQHRDSRNMTILQIIALIVSPIFGILNLMLYRRKANQAETADRSKSNFLATMSHEIRTPMNAIIGIAQIQLQKEYLPKEYEAALEKIYSSGSSLLGIINDILDMSKIETGKLELHTAEYDVPSLINDAVQINIIRIGSKSIKFTLNIDETLPSRLYGDELRLKQILNNLLSNAIKYTQEGRVILSVDYISQRGDFMLRFSVEDTGQGIKKDDKQRLFSEYLRFNAEANRTTEGTGLGLNITKKLVEMMDGVIKAESEYGKGSVFTVTVKQKTVECPVIGAELAGRLRNFIFIGDRQSEQLHFTRAPMPYGSVLVVDDVETNLYVAEGMLSSYKLNIETADSGFAAIEKVRENKIYDIIFMDHMMPKMDGIETTQKLRAMGYRGVIVALTANALTGNDEMFSRHGFDGFIPKPIDIRHMNAVLNQFIRDKYPDEAKKYGTMIAAPEVSAPSVKAPATSFSTLPDGTKARLLKVFCRDAEKAAAALRETIENGDIKLLTTTAHAMKSALANIGETEKSQMAAALEKAGLNGETGFIAANTVIFIQTLENMIIELNKSTANAADTAGANVTEDAAYLKDQMRIVKTACENYDVTAACDALDRLKEKPWKPGTAAALEKLRDMLFLHSDFDGAAEQVDKIVI